MMQTGPVVTLRVAKFGASYHGLGFLLSESTSEPTTDRSHAYPNGKSLVLYGVVGPGPSEQLTGSSKRKKEQMMQRNRQLFRSNPNMTTGFAPEDGDEPRDPVVRGNNISAVSSINLCTDKGQREYLTLPTPKSQDKNLSEYSRPQQAVKVSLRPLDGQSASKRTFMRQALSQENLCVDSGGPLLDKRQNLWEQREQRAKQSMSHYSSFPIRSSVSTNDILSDNATKTQRTSGAGVWRTPFTQHPTPMPSIQPIRIDIPVTRAVNTNTKANPTLTTFKSSTLTALKKSQTLQVNGNKQNQQHHIYACPIAATKKLPQPSLLSPPQKNRATKPQVSITPTKHVSFQDPPTQQKQSIGPTKQKENPQNLSDPWKRDAQEKLEKQQRLHVVELLQQEVLDLEGKAKRTAEENDRLRKLSLEWQFQKRLREIEQRGEDEDEEEDEDMDMMVMIQQMENRAQNRRSSTGNVNTELKELENHPGTHPSHTEEKAKTERRQSGPSEEINSTASDENQQEKTKRLSAPEKLTFKERQRLFSLATSA